MATVVNFGFLSASYGATPRTATMPFTATPGNSLIVIGALPGAVTVTDDQSNTWASDYTAGGVFARRVASVGTAPTTLTLAWDGGGSVLLGDLGTFVIEVSGLPDAAPASTAQSSNTASPVDVEVTTTGASDFIVVRGTQEVGRTAPFTPVGSGLSAYPASGSDLYAGAAAGTLSASPTTTNVGYDFSPGAGTGCSAWAFVYAGAAAVPTISSVTPSTIAAGSNPVIAGTNFEASQGTGTVKLSPTDNVADANAVTQTIAASGWSDTSITLNGVSFPTGTAHNATLYLFVTNNSSDSNAAGEAVTAYIAPTLTSPTAVSIGTTTVTPRVTTDTGNGTCYYVITPQAEGEPSNTQVEAGQNAAGGAPVASGSQVVSASGVITFSEVTGLTAGTAYRISYAHSGTPS